ncbi:MAG: hypothetical protein HY553_08690 [Elusimicrobia bacterium]|nr:hypothetical protein [Elusimicrobiota bacterium]
MPRLPWVLALWAAASRAAAFDVPEPGPPVELSASGWRSLVFEYRIEAPAEVVWRLYTTTPLDRLLPAGWTRPTLRTHLAVCPGGARRWPTRDVWPAVEPGIELQGVLHWGPTHQAQDMVVSEVQPPSRLGFRYAARSPAEGDQTLDLIPATTLAGGPATRIIHSTRYRGKNPVNSAFYPYVHRTLLDAWHLGAKQYLESRRWAAGFCQGAEFAPEFERLRARASEATGRELRPETFRRALCLFSRRSFGAASEIPRTEDALARWTGALAAALSDNEWAALRAYRRAAEAEDAALAAGAAACQ